MLQKLFKLGIGACLLFSFAMPAFAQNIDTPLPLPKGQLDQMRKFDKLQQQIQRMQNRQIQEIERALEQAGQLPVGPRAGGGGMRWGGAKLEKANAELQTQLGLGENEGLVVTAFDPNSIAEKAGLKAKDVIVKIGDKSVPNDPDTFAKLVKDQKADAPIDVVVVRNGKEETIKGAQMPALVQNGPDRGNFGRNFGGANFGGANGGIAIQIGKLNQRLQMNPLMGGGFQDLHIDMTVNGERTVRDQKGDQFSGLFSRDDLKITVKGKIENGQARPSEIAVTEGKDTKKYGSVAEVPAQHRAAVQQLVPSPLNNLMPLPIMPNFPDFPDFPDLFPDFRE